MTDDQASFFSQSAESPSPERTPSLERSALPDREQGEATRIDRCLHELPLLQDWRRLNSSDRAFIIEFGGMPKAGKSSAIEGIRHFVSHGYDTKRWKDSFHSDSLRYLVHTPAEGVSLRTPTTLKPNKLDFNAWAGAYALQELLQARHDRRTDLVILDRGPWDAACWLEYWSQKGAPKEVHESVSSFFRQARWLTRADLHVVLLVDPTEAVRRENRLRLIEHGGASADKDLMREINNIYTRRFQHLQEVKAKECPHIGEAAAICIDTTSMANRSVILMILEQLFVVLRIKVENKIATLPGIDKAWVLQQLTNSVDTIRSADRQKLDEYLSDFVENVKGLPPVPRYRVRERLKIRLEAPGDLKIGRVRANQIIEHLKTLLKEAEADFA